MHRNIRLRDRWGYRTVVCRECGCRVTQSTPFRMQMSIIYCDRCGVRMH
ncbi:hypothetical protein [Natronorarus salvus]